MTDYSLPPVTDNTALELAKSISNFADQTEGDFIMLYNLYQNEINKRYFVNHEPQIELPFDKEYDYVCDRVNRDIPHTTDVSKYPHIFISGYLRSGDKLQFKPYSDDPNTYDNYSAIYINGFKVSLDVQQEYICLAEDGALEKLNLFILGLGETLNPNLAVEYSDLPLKDFKMIVYNDTDPKADPVIDSFLASPEIQLLKCIGDLTWSYSDICSLNTLEVTGDITVTGSMKCNSLRTLIIPNVIDVPDTNTLADEKNNLYKPDITNVSGTVGNLSYAIFDNLTLSCGDIANYGMRGAYVNKFDTGDRCSTIGTYAFNDSTVREIRVGKSVVLLKDKCFHSAPQLQKVTFDNIFPIRLSGWSLSYATNLHTIHFRAIDFAKSDKWGNIFPNLPKLTTVTFLPDSISGTISFPDQTLLSEQSCLSIINGVQSSKNIAVTLNATPKNKMLNEWYCKFLFDEYVSCSADDEGAITQAEALIAKGGSLT